MDNRVYTSLILKKNQLDKFIILLMFFVLPVDMLNGIMLKAHINLPLSVSQAYKSLLIMILFFRLFLFPKIEILVLTLVFVILSLPSFIHYFFGEETDAFLLNDIIKTFKYITPFLAFIYFKQLFQDGSLFKWIKYWFYFSYALFAFNILLKYVGLGFPMYSYANTGSKGFFYSGNEISALLLVLYSFIAYKFWEIDKNKFRFFAFFLFNLLIGITITSKTAMLGIVLITIFILISFKELWKISFSKIATAFIILVVGIPSAYFLASRMLSNSLIVERLRYFYNKLDLLTFIFSGRNIKAEKMFKIYESEYNFIEKLIGGGQYFYESKLGNVIEIDFLDLFFAYGLLGAGIFLLVLGILLTTNLLKLNSKNYAYAKLNLVMLLILVFTSSIAGHVFNSGIAGFYIGCILSISYFKTVKT